jgi:hypothetical protein
MNNKKFNDDGFINDKDFNKVIDDLGINTGFILTYDELKRASETIKIKEENNSKKELNKNKYKTK